jgi:hypothetical protein
MGFGAECDEVFAFFKPGNELVVVLDVINFGVCLRG